MSKQTKLETIKDIRKAIAFVKTHPVTDPRALFRLKNKLSKLDKYPTP